MSPINGLTESNWPIASINISSLRDFTCHSRAKHQQYLVLINLIYQSHLTQYQAFQ